MEFLSKTVLNILKFRISDFRPWEIKRILFLLFIGNLDTFEFNYKYCGSYIAIFTIRSSRWILFVNCPSEMGGESISKNKNVRKYFRNDQEGKLIFRRLAKDSFRNKLSWRELNYWVSLALHGAGWSREILFNPHWPFTLVAIPWCSCLSRI